MSYVGLWEFGNTVWRIFTVILIRVILLMEIAIVSTFEPLISRIEIPEHRVSGIIALTVNFCAHSFDTAKNTHSETGSCGVQNANSRPARGDYARSCLYLARRA